jgi:signal transduction histidine kinase/ligand-binding sensor domain-containing protein/DNA-binding response OmpR family regulator
MVARTITDNEKRSILFRKSKLCLQILLNYNMIGKTAVTLIIYFLLISVPGFGQQGIVNFVHYNSNKGLLPNSNNMVQDKDGFLWIAGTRGIVRFDGYNFVNFNEIIFESENYKILSLLADGDFLWIGTENQGLYKYKPSENKLEKYVHDLNDPKTISNNQINEIFKDNQGDIWLGTWFGLSKLDPNTGKVENFPFDTPGSRQIYNYSKIEKIVSDGKGNLWIGTWGGGLHKFDPDSKTFEHFENILEKGSGNLWVKDLYYENNKLWIATIGEGLLIFDVLTKKSEQILFNPNSLSKGYKRLLSIFAKSDSEFWIGSEEGLILFDRVSKDYQIIKDNGQKRHSLISRNVEYIFEDNHKGIWVLAGGLNYYNYGADKFALVSNESTNPKDREIHGFLDVDDNEIWISKSSGIFSYNPKTGESSEMPNTIPGIAHKMLKLQSGKIAAISTREGFTIYDPQIRKSKNFKFNEQNLSESLISSVLFDIAEDSLGNLWIAGNNGLSYFRFKDQRFFHFNNSPDYEKGLKSSGIQKLIFDKNDELWIFSSNYQIKFEHLDPSLFQVGGPSGLVKDSTLYAFKYGLTNQNFKFTIYTGSEFIIVSSNITAFDPETQTTREIISKNDLIDKEIRGIELDNQFGLWVTTNNGIMYLNLKTNELTNFYENDGVQANGFNQYAIYKNKEGQIYAGGNNGFNIIEPSQITLNDYLPPVKIVNFSVLNKEARTKPAYLESEDGKIKDEAYLIKSPSYQNEIILGHDQNLLTIEFAALSFLYPEENQYAYMIEGVDKDWNYVQNRRFVSYSNLPEGEWLTFKVKASNNNGIWSRNEASLRIFVSPPIWNTLWFKVLALFLLGSIILGIYFVRVSQLKSQRRKLEDQVRQRTKVIEEKQQEISLQNEKLLSQSEELKIQNSNTVLFSEMGKKITASINLKDIYQKIYELLNEVIDASHLAIGEVNRSNNSMDYWEIIHGEIDKQSIDLDDKKRLSIYSYRKNQSVFSNNIKEDIKMYLDKPDDQYKNDQINSAIYIPLQSPSNKVIGILVVKSKKKNAFEQKNVNLLKNIAVYISIALDNSNKYKKIQQQSEQLSELDRIKTRFYTNISHEFRTPLSLILGPIEELQKGKNLTFKERKYVNIIQQNGTRLLRLVTQIMDLSKLEDGVLRLEVSQGDICDTLHSIIDSFYFVAEKKYISLRVNSELKSFIGYFDKDKIEKIAYNLLNNAFKYTDPGKDVEVNIRFIRDLKQKQAVQFAIKDTGIGISSAEIDNIFQQYYRVQNNYTQNVFGTGIGLSLVKKLVELHHGHLEVESEEGIGTTFTVTIPLEMNAYKHNEIVEDFINNPDAELNLADKESNEDKAIPELQSSEVKRKIMIVEDNEELLQFLESTLSNTFEIIKATDGKAAIDILENEKPELVVSDVMMPKMNGFELCRRIKEKQETMHIPVILLTAKSSKNDQYKGLEFGADEYLAKPVNIEVLELRIKNFMKTLDSVKTKYENNLIGDIDKLEVSDNHKEFIRSVVKILEENITNQDLNIDFFAQRLGVSRTLLYDKIKKATGESLGIFIKTSRLNYSAKVLLENHYNTSQLAYAVGFNDPKYFSKCFRNHFGKSPKEFLKSKIETSKI